MSKVIEFYGGPVDGTIREVPDNCNISDVEVFVSFAYSPSGKSRYETHTYSPDDNSKTNTIDGREIFRWRSFKIKEV